MQAVSSRREWQSDLHEGYDCLHDEFVTAIRVNGRLLKFRKQTSCCPLFIMDGLVFKVDDTVVIDDCVRYQIADSIEKWRTIRKTTLKRYFVPPIAYGTLALGRHGEGKGLMWMAQEYVPLREIAYQKLTAIEVVCGRFDIEDVSFYKGLLRNCGIRESDSHPVIYDWAV